MQEKIDRAFATAPLIAVLRGITPTEVPGISEALVECGFTILEVPLNSPEPYESIRLMRRHCGEEVVVGAGTVLRPEDVGRVIDSGGEIVVTPDTNPPVIDAALRQGVEVVPGCLTPSEVLTAVRHGARRLKIFPVARLGSGYLRDVRAVLPSGIQLLGVGGMNADTMEEYFRCGADGFGFGTNLYAPGRAPSEVRAVATTLVRTWSELKGR